MDFDSPQLLIAVSSEIEAGAIRTALAAEGVEARIVGELTAGFRVEAPGMVRVMVRQQDLAKARELLPIIRDEAKEIDWSQVDVGEPKDE